MKKLLLVLCAMTLIFGMVGSVSATPITYDFAGSWTSGPQNNGQERLVFEEGGVELVATASIGRDPLDPGDIPTVTWRDNDGLGVKYAPGGGDPRIDTSEGDDYLHFTFDDPMLMVGVTFGRWDSDEKWDLFLDGASSPTVIDSTDIQWVGAELASTFTFRADGDSGGFSLATLTVKPVPEPASILLLGAGIIGLAGFGRKFRK